MLPTYIRALAIFVDATRKLVWKEILPELLLPEMVGARVKAGS